MNRKTRISRTAAPLLASALILSACSSDPFNQDPQISNMQVDRNTIPEAAFVSVPMPAPQVKTAPVRAEQASLWASGSDGFFSDQRATKVGDILTILIEIEDEASLSNATSRQRDGGAQIGYPKLFGYGTQIDKILPGVGPEDLPSDDIVDVSGSLNAQGSGSIDRNESIRLKLAALVVQKLPNDNLVVAGRQEVKVNQELRELRVAGIIRPEDILMNNTIPYEKIAEARITYGGKGQLSRQQKRSYGEGALDIILPF